MLQLLLTLPVGSVACERSFSNLRRNVWKPGTDAVWALTVSMDYAFLSSIQLSKWVILIEKDLSHDATGLLSGSGGAGLQKMLCMLVVVAYVCWSYSVYSTSSMKKHLSIFLATGPHSFFVNFHYLSVRRSCCILCMLFTVHGLNLFTRQYILYEKEISDVMMFSAWTTFLEIIY